MSHAEKQATTTITSGITARRFLFGHPASSSALRAVTALVLSMAQIPASSRSPRHRTRTSPGRGEHAFWLKPKCQLAGDHPAQVRTGLTGLFGIGALLAGKILARVGSIHRFASAAVFASYTGTAPIAVSSGDVVRHRLSRARDRQLNYALHVMASTQVWQDTPGRAYYQRKRAAEKSHKEALRCVKRR
jgi:hypothetical protein